MENLIPDSKIYTERQIALGTFIGGPLASGILISQNYKRLGNTDAAKRSLYSGILVCIILLLFFYLSPHSLIDKIPNTIIPVFNILVAYLIVHYLQGEKIYNFLKEGGKKESYGKTIGIGLLCSVVLFVFLIIIILNKAPYDGDVKIFEKTNSIYYDTNIQSAEIDLMGTALTGTGLFSEEAYLEVQLREEHENVYHMFITVDKEYWYDQELIDMLLKAGEKIESELPGKKIQISFYTEGISKTETKKIKGM